MVYWINGPYGVGKSTVAEVLQKKLPKAHIFDAEEVGNAIRDNFPEESKYTQSFFGWLTEKVDIFYAKKRKGES